MNVRSDPVTRVPLARILPVRLDAVVPNQLWAIRIQRLDACCQINVVAVKIAPEIWPVSKANAPIRARLLNADEMLDAKQTITRLYAIVLLAIWAIRLTKPLDASASNVSAMKTAASINNAIHKRINAKVSLEIMNYYLTF